MLSLEQYKKEREEYLASLLKITLPEAEMTNLLSEISVDFKRSLPQWNEYRLAAANYPTIMQLLESTEGKMRLNDIIKDQFDKNGFQIKSFDAKSLSKTVISCNEVEKISLSFTIEEKK